MCSPDFAIDKSPAPAPDSRPMAGLIIAPRARIFHGHEWVYATEIKKSFGDPQPGDVVTLKDFRDRPLGSIDRAKLNVKGSSLAVGHPFAATGARIVATLAKLIERYEVAEDSPLARWLLSRTDTEVAVHVRPGTLSSWDYSPRM